MFTHNCMIIVFSLTVSLITCMILFACCLLILEEGHSLTLGCVYIFSSSRGVWSIPEASSHPSCSLYVKTVVISRFSSMCVYVSVIWIWLVECQPPLHYRERIFGGGWKLWQSWGGWCHAWVSACKPTCFLHQWKKQSSREYIWKFQRVESDTAAPSSRHVQSMNERMHEERCWAVGGKDRQRWMEGRNSREMADVLEGQRDGQVN